MSRCKVCGKPIRFVKSVAGRPIPCDLGLVKYWPVQGGAQRVVRPDGQGWPAGWNRYPARARTWGLCHIGGRAIGWVKQGRAAILLTTHAERLNGGCGDGMD